MGNLFIRITLVLRIIIVKYMLKLAYIIRSAPHMVLFVFFSGFGAAQGRRLLIF